MRIQALSVVVKVKKAQENDLKRVLQEIGANPDSNPYICLGKGGNTHLANWVIVCDPENGYRLFFASNYNGTVDSYVQEMLSVGPGIDDIFKYCEGYGGRSDFLRFVKANSYKSQTFFVSWPHETVQTVLAKISLRKQIETLLNMRPVADAVNEGALPVFFKTLEAVASPTKPGWLETLFSKIGQWLHTVFWNAVLGASKWYACKRVNDHFTSVASGLGQPLGESNLSDANHMTNLIDVKPGLVFILRISLWIMEQMGLHAFPPGQLAGVTTIKFARWILVDNGRRLLFQSRFDGTWENYMGDFVDKIAWGLDSIWANTVGYPTAGMTDIDSFKRFIRSKQFEHLAIYEAYPIETVLNLGRDRDLATLLTTQSNPEAVMAWLQLG